MIETIEFSLNNLPVCQAEAAVKVRKLFYVGRNFEGRVSVLESEETILNG